VLQSKLNLIELDWHPRAAGSAQADAAVASQEPALKNNSKSNTGMKTSLIRRLPNAH
jgi:hypothetical protein